MITKSITNNLLNWEIPNEIYKSSRLTRKTFRYKIIDNSQFNEEKKK